MKQRWNHKPFYRRCFYIFYNTYSTLFFSGNMTTPSTYSCNNLNRKHTHTPKLLGKWLKLAFTSFFQLISAFNSCSFFARPKLCFFPKKTLPTCIRSPFRRCMSPTNGFDECQNPPPFFSTAFEVFFCWCCWNLHRGQKLMFTTYVHIFFLYITYYKYNYRRISTPPPKKKMKGLGVSPKLISCWIDSMLVGFSVFHVGIFRFRVGVFGALFFQVTLFVGFKWPFHRLHDLQLGIQKKHLKKTWFLKNHPSHQAFVCWQGTHTNSNIACDWMRFQPSLQHTTHQL